MKRIVMVLAVLMLAGSATAEGIATGVGVYFGPEIPIIQDDQATGTVFGFKGRVKALPMLTLEPNINFTSYGSPDIEDVIGDPDGSKVTSFGLDAVLGSPVGGKGMAVLLSAGLGSYKMKNDQTKSDFSKLGYSLGAGLEFGVSPTVGLEARAKGVVFKGEDGGTKKSIAITAGLNYHFAL